MRFQARQRNTETTLADTTLRLYISGMNGRELAKHLKEHGWKLDRIKGSHHIFIKEGKRAIPVPVHGTKELPRGLVSAIMKQADLKKGK